MTKLNELINELCPDGVEYKALGDIATDVFRGSGIKRDQVTEDGIPCVRYGEIYTTYGIWFDSCVSHTQLEYVSSPKYFSHGDILFAITGESVEDIAKSCAYVGNEKCLAGGDIVVLKHNENPKYLSYALATEDARRQKSAGKVKSKVVHSSVPAIKAIKIPVPPLPVQEEIVRILDKFTSLEAELEAELEARKKQYEFYRDRLLTFGDVRGGATSDVVWRTLGDICKKVVSGGTPQAGNPEYYGGTIPWLRTQEVDWKDITDTVVKITEAGLNASSAKWIPENCVIVAMYGATAAKVAINKIPLTTNQACCNLEIDENQALYRYVFHWLCKEYLSLKALGQGSQSNINAQTIKQYKIPIPSLEIQNKIVNVLDNFDAICSDLNIGLPAEIEARKKQYEFYRDALLTYAATGRTILTDRQTSIVR